MNGPFLDNLCENCYKKENPLEIKKLDILQVEICPECGTLRVMGNRVDTWKRDENLEEIIREVTRRAIIEKLEVDTPLQYEFEDDIEESKIMNYGVKEFTTKTSVFAKPHKDFSEFEEVFTTRLRMRRATCDECSKYKTGYYEAILQVRGEDRKLTKKEEEDIEELIERMMKQYEDARMAYILDLDVDRDGITATVSTKFLAESLAKEIKGVSAGKINVAYEHKTTSRDGIDVFTNTYLVKLPAFAKGTVLEYDKILWVVKNVSEQQIKMESLENHEIRQHDRKRVESRGKRRDDEIVKREYMIVSKDKNTVVIMALDNYENFEDNLERLPPKKEEGENIIGFIYDDKNYYLE
jgi:nonsense-mediated mRNA decay protein 3